MELVNCCLDATFRSPMYGLPRPPNNIVDVDRVVGDLPFFATIAGILVSDYVRHGLALLFAYGR